MKVAVTLFARARDLAGCDRVELELPDGADVAALRQALRGRAPGLEALSGHLLIAVNNQYAREESPVSPGDEIACFPPVSGG